MRLFSLVGVLLTLSVLATQAAFAQTIIKQQDPAPTSITFGNNSGVKTQVVNNGQTMTQALVPGVIASRTVGSGNTLYVNFLEVMVTAPSQAVIDAGRFYIESPLGQRLISSYAVLSNGSARYTYQFAEPITATQGAVFRVVADPDVSSQLFWKANFVGYEK